MFKGNAAQTGEYSSTPIEEVKGIKYSFRTDGPIRSSVVISDGMLFFGSSDGNLYAINEETGKESWRFKTEGEIHSTPAVANGKVFFVSRDGNFYALQARSGKLIFKYAFKKDMPYENGWDYYLSSPVVTNASIYVGSGDGGLYCFDLVKLRLKWRFDAGSRIRTSPAVSENAVIAATFAGYVFAVDKESGKELWKFETAGATLDFKSAGYDRTSLLGSPSYKNGAVLVGGRDGFLYAIDALSGKLKWKSDHEGSWVLSTAITDKYAYAGSGSTRFVQQLDATTGTETWRFTTDQPIFSSMGITGQTLYTADYAGNIYAVNTQSGKAVWKFPLGRRIYGTPVVNNHTLFIGCDDGYLYAIEAESKTPSFKYVKPKKIVFYEENKSDKTYVWYRGGLDKFIRDFFVTNGYELMNGAQVTAFMQSADPGALPSVVVLATTIAPKALMDPNPETNPLRTYLQKGGKVVMLGPNPLAFHSNAETGGIDSIDFQNYPRKVLDIDYEGGGNINMDACYISHPTAEGSLLGLKNYWTGYGAITPDASTRVLAVDQYNQPSCWIRTYGGRRGTGLMQLMVAKEWTGLDISTLRPAIEYGLEW